MIKKILKIIALTLVVSIVAGIVYLVMLFYGNPFEYLSARKTAEEHLKTNYADTDYEIERIAYFYQSADYFVYVIEPNSEDSRFAISVDNDGTFQMDNYEERVVERGNTVNRLEEEYYAAVLELFRGEDYPYNESMTSCDIKFDYEEGEIIPEGAILRSELELDKEYDISQLAKKQGYIETNVMNEEVSFERAAEILLDIKRRADEKGLSFYEIDFDLYGEGNSWGPDDKISVSHFLYEDIYEEGLVERIQAAHEAAQAS